VAEDSSLALLDRPADFRAAASSTGLRLRRRRSPPDGQSRLGLPGRG